MNRRLSARIGHFFDKVTSKKEHGAGSAEGGKTAAGETPAQEGEAPAPAAATAVEGEGAAAAKTESAPVVSVIKRWSKCAVVPGTDLWPVFFFWLPFTQLEAPTALEPLGDVSEQPATEAVSPVPRVSRTSS
jgi:hypothetical protein